MYLRVKGTLIHTDLAAAEALSVAAIADSSMKELIDKEFEAGETDVEAGEKYVEDIKTVIYEIVIDRTFKEPADAESFFELLKTEAGVGFEGIISTHYCPNEGEIPDWQGCKNDPRSQYQEMKWQ